MESTLTGKVVTVQYITFAAGDSTSKTKAHYCTGTLESIEIAGGLGTVALDCRILPWARVESIVLTTSKTLLSSDEVKVYGERVNAQRAEREGESE